VTRQIQPDWPGFRGFERNSVVSGIRIKTDWRESPPVEIWRHAVGPGWSSFAVGGGLIYTQEQRGDVEVVALTLSQWREPLEALRSGSAGSEAMVAQLSSDPRFRETLLGAEGHLEPVRTWAERLLRLISLANPLAKILIERDVLGIYAYESLPLLPDPPRNPTIELHWAVIGLVAPAIGVSIEDLTVVVLAHELGHAYSHIGGDIDGRYWPTAAFGTAERGLVEGVAQYYTQRVCLRLQRQCPGALKAYEALLEHQPKQYRMHEVWVQKASPEEVRFAMIEVRRRGLTSLSDFNDVVEEARSRWRSVQ